MDNLTGQLLKGYELRKELGAGGFGAVYLAYQPAVKREVAIKVILPQFANQPDFIRRFEVEAELVARLEHPHIVPLFDYWRDPNGAYLVLRYLRGGSLRASLMRGAWGPERTGRMLEQIAGALVVAHRNNVIHRDLKPDNILLDEDGNAYLTDFGIAKEGGAKGETDSEGVVGSPAYMAPEQIKEQPVTPRTDIYGLGVLIYETLTGEHPFAGGDFFSIIRKHLDEPLPSLYEFKSELPKELDDVLQKATAKEPDERYTDAISFAKAFKAAIAEDGGQAVETSSTGEALTITFTTGVTRKLAITDDFLIGEVKNPYKGLRPFAEADAGDFFGREALIQHLVAKLSPSSLQGATVVTPGGSSVALSEISEREKFLHFLAVVGPSGSGKSSVVKAGLIPALRRNAIPGSNKWFIVEMVPGTQPLLNLETALLSVAINPPPDLGEHLRENKSGLLAAVTRIVADTRSELLLYIDQFEELFTLSDNEHERAHFLDLLRIAVGAPNSPLRVIVTIRADFYDRPLNYVGFGELIRQRTEVVLPLSPDELERAITGPAHRVGLHVDSELIAAIIADVSEEPGALPLLQYVLTELFERREGMTLTLRAYQQIGGVLGALARRAEEVYLEMSPDQQATTRQVFLRLVTLGEGVEDTRRRTRRSELEAISSHSMTTSIDAVLDMFGKYRLLTFDRESDTREPTIEVAHEALIREWARLRTWLDESRADIRLQRLLAGAAAEWEKSRRDVSYLLGGARLAQYEDWVETTDIALTPSERAYLEASSAEQRKKEAEERERQQREIALQKKAANRLRYFAGALSIFLLVAIGLSVFAFTQQQEAQDSADEAQRQRQAAVDNLAEAERQRTIAQENFNEAETQRQAAQDALDEAETQRQLAEDNAAEAERQRQAAEDALDEAETQRQLAEDNAAEAERQRQAAQDALAEAETQRQAAEDALAEAEEQRQLAETNATEAETQRQTAEDALAEAETQRQLAEDNAAEAETQRQAAEDALAEAEEQRQIAQENFDEAERQRQAAEDALAEAETQRQLAEDNAAEAETQRQAAEDALAEAERQRQVAEENAAIAQERGTEIAQQVSTVERALNVSEESERLARAQALTVSADRALEFGNPDLALALVLESIRLDPTLVLAQSVLNSAVTQSAALIIPGTADALLSPDERYLLTISSDRRSVTLWDIRQRAAVHEVSGHSGGINVIQFTLDGTAFITGGGDGLVIVWDTAAGNEKFRLQGHAGPVTALAMHPDGNRMVSAGLEPLLILWDVRSGQQVRTFAQANPDPINRLFISLDGGTLFSWTDNIIPIMALWNIETGQLRYRSQVDYRGFSQDRRTAWTGGKRFARVNGEKNVGAVTFYEAVTESTQRTLSAQILDWQKSEVIFVSFSRDGRLALIGADVFSDVEGELRYAGREIIVLDRNNNAVLARYQSGRGDLTGTFISAEFAPLGTDEFTGELLPASFALSTTPDDRLILWDVLTGQIVRQIGADDIRLANRGFSRNGTYALTVSVDGTARVWIAGNQESAVLSRLENIHAVSPDGNAIAISDEFNVVYVVETRTGRVIQDMQGHGNLITAGVFTPDGQSLITGDKSGTIIQWDWQNARVRNQWLFHENEIVFLSVSPDGQFAFSRSIDGVRRFWEVASGVMLRRLGLDAIPPAGGQYGGGIFNADSSRIYWLSQNNLFSEDMANPPADAREVALQYDSATTVAENPNLLRPMVPVPFVDEEGGRFIQVRAIAAEDFALFERYVGLLTYALEVYDLESGEMLLETIIPNALTADFSPDGRFLMVGMADHTVLMFDVNTGEQVRRFVGHTEPVLALAFSPDGLRAISGAQDGLILWHVATAQSIRSYRAEIYEFTTQTGREVVIDPNRPDFIEFNSDGTVFIVQSDAYIPFTGAPELPFGLAWRIDPQEAVIELARNGRTVLEFTCAQRDQFNIRPLCGE